MNGGSVLLEVGGLRHAFGKELAAGVMVLLAVPGAFASCVTLSTVNFVRDLHAGEPPILMGYLPWVLALFWIGRRRIAAALAAFPLLVGCADVAHQLAWRSGCLFYPLLLIGQLVLSTAGLVQTVRAFAKARALRVALDDAGLRVARGAAREYWPLALLDRIEIEAESRLVVRAANGTEVARVELMSRHAVDAAVALQARFAALIEQRNGHAAVESACPHESLDDWCRELRRVALRASGAAYRENALDWTSIVEAGRHPGASVESRAAATHLSILAGGDAALRARAELGVGTPPLELALAALAAGTPRVVSSRIWGETTCYLEPSERDELCRALAR